MKTPSVRMSRGSVVVGTACALPGAVLLGAVALSGCAQIAPAGPTPERPLAEVITARDCLAAGLVDEMGVPEEDAEASRAPRAGAIPDDFQVAELYRCDPSGYLRDAGGRWVSAREEQLDGDVSDVADVLSVPSDPRSNGPCTADFELVPTIWLVDPDGRAMLPEWPVNGCGKLKEEVKDLFADLRVVATVEVRPE